MDYKIRIEIMKGNKEDATYYFNELKVNLKRCYEEVQINDNLIKIDEANIEFALENRKGTYFIYEYFY